MKKLPIAKTVFKEIIKEDCCYADKTKQIKILKDYPSKYFFLSRPRRFGKTLFLDTLRAAYAGEKELFKGLYLENNWDWSKKYPVITISWGAGFVETKEELEIRTIENLKECYDDYDLTPESESSVGQFKELITKLYKKYNSDVVILIDEYDKPILDNLTKPKAKEIREKLAGFYSVLKDADKYLKFVFMTGVSKFSKTSIFSKLNNITDISMSPQFADVCGYTQLELEDVFKEYLIDVDLEKVKEWYNGYNFLGSNVYNPFDILFFLYDKRYKSYWFETGTPTFLLEIIKQQKYCLPKLQNIQLSESELSEFDIDRIKLETLLFQTGYLTITKTINLGNIVKYRLSIPNKEVQIGLNDYLLSMFFNPGDSLSDKSKLTEDIYYALTDNHPETLENAFETFFEGVPHDWYRKNNIADYEGYYCSTFYAFFAALGFDVIPEDVTKNGDIDMTVKIDDSIFIFEFKMKNNPKNAMQQIKQKGYHKKYLNDKKNIFLIGIEFDREIKNISQFQIEKINREI